MGEWQPIETAPKDGRKIILLNDGRVLIGWWIDRVETEYGKITRERKYWHLGPYSFGHDPAPSHWMPLPESPNA